ncbi:BQ2448_1753 [Microbotryum intermedium]|uniref:LYR motif-containing protein 2 n=1 Tax=Microbotryum intermedium TaxID=269621 RepID=A0A238FC47_9BASI|nr:BQ2448_1753 [Microbotryum intermedium]
MIRLSAPLLAPVKPRTTRLRSCNSSPLLPLDYPLDSAQFVNHAKSLSLYRSFIRATRNLGNLEARWDTLKWIRTDFERYKGLVDSEKAKSLLSLGARQLKQLNSTGSLIGTDGSKFRGTKRA